MKSFRLPFIFLVPILLYVGYVAINPSLEGTVSCSGTQALSVESPLPTSRNPLITLDNLNSLALTATLQHGDGVTDFEFTPDGKWLVASSGPEIKVWDLETYEEVQTFDEHTHQILSLALSLSGTLLASGGRDESVIIWDLTILSSVVVLDNFTQDVHGVLFNVSGDMLISASSQEYALAFWDMSNYSLIRKLRSDIIVDSVALHPSGKCLAISEMPRGWTGGNLIKLIDIETGEEETLPKTYNGDVTRVVFSPNGDYVASAGADGSVRLWDVNSKSERLVLNHQSSVNSVAFEPTGTILAAAVGDLGGRGDNNVTLWDAATGLQLMRLTGHTNLVSDVAFNPAGDLLASASFDGTVRIWSVQQTQ